MLDEDYMTEEDLQSAEDEFFKRLRQEESQSRNLKKRKSGEKTPMRMMS